MAEIISMEGGNRLVGQVRVEGAKNACLPIMAATLLCEEQVVLYETPPLEDVQTMCKVLGALGVSSKFCEVKRKLCVSAGQLNLNVAPADLVRQMRASFLVIGPLLARTGRARV